VGPCALVLLLLPCFRSRGMLLSLGSGAAFGAASLCLDLLPFVPVLFLACPASVVRYGLLVLPGGLRVGSPGPGRGLLFLVWMDRWVLGRCDGKE
jgi:hypothetical protein